MCIYAFTDAPNYLFFLFTRFNVICIPAISSIGTFTKNRVRIKIINVFNMIIKISLQYTTNYYIILTQTYFPTLRCYIDY